MSPLDSSFSSFIDGDQLPVAFPLRSPVYVEVSIRQPAPEPGLSLQVRDCFAYPASRTSVWILLYDGSAACITSTSSVNLDFIFIPNMENKE